MAVVAQQWVANRPQWLRDAQVFRRRAVTFVQRAFTYIVLIDIGFVFLIPIFYILATSLKTAQDLTDPTIVWIPSGVFWINYPLAFLAMNYPRSLSNSLWISLGSAVGQTISCAFVGYGFARVKFPGRDVLFALVVFTFLVPPQTIIVPLFILYKNLGWINSYNPFIVPSFFGHGLKGALLMAAVFLVILPPLSIYMFPQRFFVESIDRTGLVE